MKTLSEFLLEIASRQKKYYRISNALNKLENAPASPKKEKLEKIEDRLYDKSYWRMVQTGKKFIENWSDKDENEYIKNLRGRIGDKSMERLHHYMRTVYPRTFFSADRTPDENYRSEAQAIGGLIHDHLEFMSKEKK